MLKVFVYKINIKEVVVCNRLYCHVVVERRESSI
jgi:hypothetical protein